MALHEPSGSELEIAGAVVARAQAGTLEAEYAMFDASEIELRATDYGAIREVGYRTSVADALARLDAAGATSANVRELTNAISSVARHYMAPRALPLLGVLTTGELLTGDTFDADRRIYTSPLIDLPRLASDSGATGAVAALQAAGLAALLREARPDDEVILRTAEHMASRRPGERSIRRVSLGAVRALPAALARLREAKPNTLPEVPAATLVAWMRRRGIPAPRLAWAELVLQHGRVSEKGPLALPRAAAIDVLIATGRASEAIPLIDRLEVESGRTSAVQFLRLHAAFVTKSDPVAEIAERAGTLLARDPSLELKILVAQAWREAGQTARAASIANDILSDPKAPSALKDDARKLVEFEAEVVLEDTPRASASVAPTPRGSATTAPPPPGPTLMRPSAPSLVLDLPRPPSPSVAEITGYDPLSRRPTPAPVNVATNPQQAFIMGVSMPPQMTPPTVSKAPTPKAPPVVQPTPSAIPTLPPPPGMNPAMMPEAQRSIAISVPPRVSQQPPVPGNPAIWERGASRPPYQSGPPPSAFQHAPIPFNPRPPEQAETLSLPPGLHGQAVPFDAVPKTVIEARIQFTLLSRSLGRTYRERYGIVLRSDLKGVEQMQNILRQRFTTPAIRNAEEATEVRSHGAFLSEILARTFGAEWSDIAPSELGYWAMITPRGLRLWPFGRILRFILGGDREKDLVGYYLELDARMRGQR